MRISAAGGTVSHLTYCTNIHAGNDWPEVRRGLCDHLPAIKKQVSPDAPLGVGLRLSAVAAEALDNTAAFEDLLAILGDDFYVFTINGFPYGNFHGEPVKEGAYKPDWGDPARLDYSNRVADHLARLLPDGMDGNVSTVPGTFKPWADDRRVHDITDNLIRHVAHLVELRRRTGKTVALSIEPEPFCFLETISETVDYFEGHLFGAAASQRLIRLTGESAAQAETSLRRHLGVCYDVCHAAVEFEDPAASLAALGAAGIAIGKLQLSSAMRVTEVQAASADALAAFDEPVYLHQVVERKDGALVRYADLPDALRNVDGSAGAEWRIHFHVPIFLERMQHFDTTQGFLRDILAIHKRAPVTQQLEVETYTWDVLPEQYRNVGIADAIARELNWVAERLR